MATKTVQDSSLTAVANAIRAKTGKSASMEFPDEFVSEIGSISGGGEVTDFKIITTLNPTIQNIIFPASIKNLVIERNKKNTAYTGGSLPKYILSVFDDINDCKLETVIIDYGLVRPSSGIDFLRGNPHASYLKTIHFYVDTSDCGSWDRFLYCPQSDVYDVVIDGTPIDFGQMNRWQNVLDARIKEARFVPDKINVSSVSINDAYTARYSNETWASLVNALKTGTTGTFSIGSTAQSTISAIMGENVSGLFEISPSGTMSLLTFATTVKGWTVA